jgi:hypothetical protein
MSDDCVERFRTFLQMVWMDNTADEAMEQWRQRVRNFPAEAGRDLDCLDAIVADPPSDVVQMLNDDGWVILSHEPDPETVVDRSRDEYVDWVRATAARFRDVYERER